MPWAKRVKRPHRCLRPEPALRRAPGSVWRCWRCGTRWRLIANFTQGSAHRWQWGEVND